MVINYIQLITINYIQLITINLLDSLMLKKSNNDSHDQSNRGKEEE